MAQNFTAIPATTQLKDSLSPLLDRDEAVASAFSGTAFPVTSLYVGMTCHRTDQGKRYVLIDLTPTWIEILSFDPVTGLAVAPRAARLATPRAISITGDVTAAGVDFDGTGPVALTATVVQASATVAGKVELATSAETATGTDTVRAVTPAGLKAVTDTLAPRANPTFTGTVTLPADAIVASNIASNAVTATKIASNAVITAKITDAAVTTSKIADGAVTAAKLGLSGTAPALAPRAWVNFNGSTGAIRASANVSSVVRDTAGAYTINFSVNMIDANYAVSVSIGNNSGFVANVAERHIVGVRSSGAVGIQTANAAEFTDAQFVDVVIFR